MEEKNIQNDILDKKEEVKEVHYYHHYDKKKFKPARVFLGLLIIFFGIIYLMKNAGWVYLDIDFVGVEKLWPLFVIFLGLSMLAPEGLVSLIISLIVTLVVIGVMAYTMFY